jgi:hypothetical protein
MNGHHDEKDSSSTSSTAINGVSLDQKYFEMAPPVIESAQGMSPGPLPDAQSLAAECTYPEGGVKAYLVVFGSWCTFFAPLGIVNALAIFQDYISEDQLSSYGPSQIGWIFSLYAFLTFSCGIYIRPIFDVHGCRWFIFPGSVCLVMSMFLLRICKGQLPHLLKHAPWADLID